MNILIYLNLLASLEAKQCPEAIIELMNDTQWNEQDEETLQHASKRCGEIYPASPCVIKITKLEDLRYYVTCGANQ